MGHTINPVTWRLGELIHWNINLFSTKISWSYLFLKFNNFFVIIFSYLKYLRKIIYRKIKFNFFSLKICFFNKKLIFLINSKIKLRKKKVLRSKVKPSNFFFNFLIIYNLNWLSIYLIILSLRDRNPNYLYMYIYLRKLPFDYKYYYIKKFWNDEDLKKLNYQKKKIKIRKSIVYKWKLKPRYRRFNFYDLNLIKEKKFICTFLINNLIFYNYLINKKKNFVKINKVKFNSVRFYIKLIRNIFSLFFVVPLLNFFKKLIIYKFYNLNNILSFFNFNINIFFLINKLNFFSADLISEYLLKRFSSKSLRTRRILFRITDYLNMKIKILSLRGYKFSITGRLTKKDRVTYIWTSRGLNSVNKKHLKIQYSFKLFKTKFSIGIIKVWLFF